MIYNFTDNAFELAYKANQTYDQRIDAANTLADTLIAASPSLIQDEYATVREARKSFSDIDAQYTTYLSAAAVLLPAQVTIK